MNLIDRYSFRAAPGTTKKEMTLGVVYQTDVTMEAETFQFSVYDCEPAGVLIVAKSAGGREYTLSPTKQELKAASIAKTRAGYETLVLSLNLLDNQLVSSLEGIGTGPPVASPVAAANYLKGAPAGEDTLPNLIAVGLTELCREKPVGLNAVEWLGKWLLSNNPNQPQVKTGEES